MVIFMWSTSPTPTTSITEIAFTACDEGCFSGFILPLTTVQIFFIPSLQRWAANLRKYGSAPVTNPKRSTTKALISPREESESREIKSNRTDPHHCQNGTRTHSYGHMHTAAISKEVHLTFVHFHRWEKKHKSSRSKLSLPISVCWNLRVHLRRVPGC